MAAVAEGDLQLDSVRQAVRKRKRYILKNAERLSMKQCRAFLEADLSLPEGALQAHRKLVERLVDEVVQQDLRHAEEKVVAMEHESKSQRKSSASEAEKRQDSAGVAKLKQLCKAATINIPPNTYTKLEGGEAELEGRLRALLCKHGLSAESMSGQVLAVRQRLQRARDLEGIDTGNIMVEGRGRRAAAQQAAEDDPNDNQSPGNGLELMGKAVATKAKPVVSSSGEERQSHGGAKSGDVEGGSAKCEPTGQPAWCHGKDAPATLAKKRRLVDWSDEDSD